MAYALVMVGLKVTAAPGCQGDTEKFRILDLKDLCEDPDLYFLHF